MTGETLHIRLETTDEFFASIRDDASAVDDDEALYHLEVLSVPDLSTLSRILSRTNLELIRTIAEHEPDSMRETARLVDRDIKNVSEDLRFLERVGVLSTEEHGRAKRPRVPYDDIEIDIPVRPNSDGRDSVLA